MEILEKLHRKWSRFKLAPFFSSRIQEKFNAKPQNRKGTQRWILINFGKNAVKEGLYQ